MATQPNNSTPSSQDPEVNKEWLYKEWLRTARWQDDLRRRTAHKAVDLPEDMGIQADNSTSNQITRNGIGWKELTAAGVLALAGWGLWIWQQQPAAPDAATIDTEYDVRFYDKDGNLIDIPNISERPKANE